MSQQTKYLQNRHICKAKSFATILIIQTIFTIHTREKKEKKNAKVKRRRKIEEEKRRKKSYFVVLSFSFIVFYIWVMKRRGVSSGCPAENETRFY